MTSVWQEKKVRSTQQLGTWPHVSAAGDSWAWDLCLLEVIMGDGYGSHGPSWGPWGPELGLSCLAVLLMLLDVEYLYRIYMDILELVWTILRPGDDDLNQFGSHSFWDRWLNHQSASWDRLDFFWKVLWLSRLLKFCWLRWPYRCRNLRCVIKLIQEDQLARSLPVSSKDLSNILKRDLQSQASGRTVGSLFLTSFGCVFENWTHQDPFPKSFYHSPPPSCHGEQRTRLCSNKGGIGYVMICRYKIL